MRLIAVLITILVCAPPFATGADDVSHAHEFESMRASMRQLDVLLAERRMTRPEIDRSRSRQASYIAAQAAALAEAAMALVELRVSEGGLPANSDTFSAYAADLANAAAALQAAVNAGEIHLLDDHLEHLQRTCAGCHTHYRNQAK